MPCVYSGLLMRRAEGWIRFQCGQQRGTEPRSLEEEWMWSVTSRATVQSRTGRSSAAQHTNKSSKTCHCDRAFIFKTNKYTERFLDVPPLFACVFCQVTQRAGKRKQLKVHYQRKWSQHFPFVVSFPFLPHGRRAGQASGDTFVN